MRIEKQITLCIKTFLRPFCCIRLIDSIRKYYPEIDILICDDSQDRWKWIEDKHTGVFTGSFDIGVSAGRNLLASQVETKYLMYLDDDFIFTQDTRLELLLELYKKYKLDILSCGLNNAMQGWQGTFVNNMQGEICACNQPKQDYGDVQLYDFTANPILIETKKALKYPWNNRQKMGEHLEFYINIKSQTDNAKIGHTHLVRILHNHDFVKIHNYTKYRDRHNSFENAWRKDLSIKIGKTIPDNIKHEIRANKIKIEYNRRRNECMTKLNDINTKWIEDNVTICIKTFLRPDCCMRAITSIRQYYPNITILICDDSSMQWEWIEDEHTRVYYAPYDIGISAGRNLLQSQVITDYVMPLDDDFVFTEQTDLVLMAKLLHKHQLDIITCKYDDRTPISYQGQVDFHNGFVELQNNIMREDLGDCQLYDYINMPPLMKTEFALKYRFDTRLKVGEHSEYYIRLKHISNATRKKFRFGRTTDASILHLRATMIVDYQPFRDRADEYRLTWTDKYNDNEHQGADVRYYRNLHMEAKDGILKEERFVNKNVGNENLKYLFAIVLQQPEYHLEKISIPQIRSYLDAQEVKYQIMLIKQQVKNYGLAYNTAVSLADNFDILVIYDPFLVPVKNVFFPCYAASQIYGSPNSAKGIFCIKKQIYEQINGFSNRYYDEFYLYQDFIERLRKECIQIDRSACIGHHAANINTVGGKIIEPNMPREKRIFIENRHLSTYTEDGLSTLISHLKSDKTDTDGKIRRVEI